MKRTRRFRRGVTLIEMLVVIVIISVAIGISFPSIASGLDSLRLNAASDDISNFLNAALNRAERRQQAMEIVIDKAERALFLHSAAPGFERRLSVPDHVEIVAVLPKLGAEVEGPRRFLIYPGGTVPRFGVEISSGKSSHRVIRVDPITGVPQVERVEAEHE